MHDSEEAIIARHAAAAGRQDAVQGLVDACESLIDAASRMDKPFAPALLDSAARDATKAFLAYRSLPPQDAALTAEREKLLRRAVTAIADVCDGGSLWQLGAVLADAARMGITEGTKCSTTSGS